MADLFDRLTAALAGRYAIERELGAGGMATVYLAHDVRHDRKVAIKVLRSELAAVLGAERFVQEIKTTANLQHPHILPLFDSGEADSFLYYVMPYIEGETLRDKLNREKQLGIDEAVKITTEVADALDYAHRHNVIHRDIKPENILLHDGRPMVADFGIALAVSAAAGGRMTETGLSLGTPHYMSPEQATAEKDLTNRSDIYSLAAVLYEMLTGNPPHTGSTAQQIIMKIVTDEARPVTELRKSVPSNVAAAVEQALEKVPADRFESAAAFAGALQDPTYPRRPGALASPERVGTGRRWLTTVPWVLVGVLAATLFAMLGTRTPSEGPIRYVNIRLPDSAPLVYIGEAPGAIGHPALALTPDGDRIVYVGRAGATTRLYVRDIDEFDVRPLPGTEGAYSPCISPDGQSVAFFAGELLKRIDLDGGQVATVTEAHWGFGCSWGPDDRLVSVLGDNRELMVGAASGGLVDRIPLSLRGGTWTGFHQWLPKTEWLLAQCEFTVCVHSSTTGEIRWLDQIGAPTLEPSASTTLRGTNPRFLAPDVLLFSDAGSNALLGVRFDPSTLQLRGQPKTLRQGIRRENAFGVIQTAVSASGDLLFAEGENAVEGQFVWADESGVEHLDIPARVYGAFSLSRDGRYVAATVYPAAGPEELWILDLDRSDERRWVSRTLLEDRRLGWFQWFPDSRRLLVSANGETSLLLEVDAMTASGGRVLWEGGGTISPERLGPSGDALLWIGPSDGAPPYLVPTRIDGLEELEGSAEVALPPVDWIPRRTFLADVSPNGAWFAYSSTESGPYEVYAQRLQPGSRPIRISRGGELPRFSPQGDRIYYRDGQRWYYVAFTGDDDEPFTSPRFVLEGEYQNVGGPEFEVSPDGKHLLLLERTAASSTTTLSLILNWRQELEELLGSGR